MIILWNTANMIKKKKIIVEILHWQSEFFWAWPLIFSYCIRIFNRCDVKVL